MKTMTRLDRYTAGMNDAFAGLAPQYSDRAYSQGHTDAQPDGYGAREEARRVEAFTAKVAAEQAARPAPAADPTDDLDLLDLLNS